VYVRFEELRNETIAGELLVMFSMWKKDSALVGSVSASHSWKVVKASWSGFPETACGSAGFEAVTGKPVLGNDGTGVELVGAHVEGGNAVAIAVERSRVAVEVGGEDGAEIGAGVNAG